ncbi:hypothetical protein DFH09DRAFT_1349648 [Mycena vulgaris]|nr:hypothetical protein DFH09DRAFT_1349648 [Mycena vulgaris]
MSTPNPAERPGDGGEEGTACVKEKNSGGAVLLKRGREDDEDDDGGRHHARPRLVCDGAGHPAEAKAMVTSDESAIQTLGVEEHGPRVSYDKAFKHRALTLAKDGIPPAHEIRSWLNIYRPPPAVAKPPGYVAGAAVLARVKERARARQARVNFLMQLREGWANVRGVIRVRRCPSPKKPAVDVKKMAEREEARARKARVQFLLKQRYGKGGKRG